MKNRLILFTITFLFISIYFNVFRMNKVHAAAIISRPVNNLGLVAYWDFNFGKGSSIVWDVSGQQKHGRFLGDMNPAVAWVDSKTGLGGALDFDGTSDFFEPATALDSSVYGTNARTISFWFNSDNFPTTPTSVMVKQATGATGTNLEIMAEDNGVSVAFNGHRPIWGKSTLSTGRWYHFALVIPSGADSGQVSGYIDGVKITPTTESGSPVSINTATQVITVGTASGPFNGRLDEIRFYNRAFSDAEVKRLYNATQPKVSTVPISNGLVGYWDFNTGKGGTIAFDRSGNNNHGTLTLMDPATDWVDSKSGLGGALDFDGSNDYVNIPDNAALKITGNQITLSAWVRTNEASAPEFDRIVVKQVANNGDPFIRYGLYRTGGSGTVNMGISTGGAGTLKNAVSLSSISTTAWTHVVGVYDGTNIKIYMNGSYENQTSATGNIGDTAEPVVIGADTAAGIEYFSGRIDEVRIYNRALSADEIKRLYNITQPKVSTVELSKGLVGYWDFNFGKGGLIAFDRSGNNRNGTLTNMDAGTDWVDGKSRLGQALDFDGTDTDGVGDYIDIGAALGNSLQSHTYSFWVKPNGANDSTDAIIHFESGADDSTIALQDSGSAGLKGIYMKTGGGTGLTQVYAFVPSAIWYHISMTWDDPTNVVKTYLNGSLVDSRSFGSSMPGDFTSGHIGRNIGSTKYFGGQLDDVRIYNRVLTQEEVTRLYLLGK